MFSAVPLVAPAGSGEPGFIQFRGPEDLRFRVINWNGFEAGPLTGWRFDRDEDDADRLDGLGDVDGGIVLGGYAAYQFGLFKPFVSYSNQVTGDDTGGLLRFGAEAPLNWGNVRMTGIVGATWADDDYMDAFFSVNSAQAVSSGLLGEYDAEAGIKDVYIGLNADVPLTDVWSLKLTGQYSRLLGDAADSPIVETENQFFGGHRPDLPVHNRPLIGALKFGFRAELLRDLRAVRVRHFCELFAPCDAEAALHSAVRMVDCFPQYWA